MSCDNGFARHIPRSSAAGRYVDKAAMRCVFDTSLRRVRQICKNIHLAVAVCARCGGKQRLPEFAGIFPGNFVQLYHRQWVYRGSKTRSDRRNGSPCGRGGGTSAIHKRVARLRVEQKCDGRKSCRFSHIGKKTRICLKN